MTFIVRCSVPRVTVIPHTIPLVIRAIVHHGLVGSAIEYFAVVVGPDVDKRFFFEQINAPRGDVIRYFGGSSEIVLESGGVRFRGNGGIFGEYMFGGHLPVGDLLNEEVVNRLVLFGTTIDPRTHDLRFTTNTEGFERWENLFLQGNASRQLPLLRRRPEALSPTSATARKRR